MWRPSAAAQVPGPSGKKNSLEFKEQINHPFKKKW